MKKMNWRWLKMKVRKMNWRWPQTETNGLYPWYSMLWKTIPGCIFWVVLCVGYLCVWAMHSKEDAAGWWDSAR